MAHAKSLLPSEKTWRLVWNDEFDGTELDTSKWGYRLHLLQKRHKTWSDKGAILDGKGNLHLTLQEADGDFLSPQLQTGSNYLDRPGNSFCFGSPDGPQFAWPIAKIEQPKFMHKYGFYEIRCKLPQTPGWWAAFWLQSPCIGATLNPQESGVEVDIMENFTRNGVISHNNYWNGYGEDTCGAHSGDRFLEETPDGFHVFGLEWTPQEYVYYVDGKVSWRCREAVSQREQFILISTECFGYRTGYTPDPQLKKENLPDSFIIDYVRVFDPVIP